MAYTYYEDQDVSIVVTHPDGETIHIVVEKPSTNPDLRFRRHIMNFYVLKYECPDGTESTGRFEIHSNFDNSEYSIELRVGRYASEANMYLGYFDPNSKQPKPLPVVEELKGAWRGYDSSAIVVINDREWGDPNMGWMSPV